MKRWVLHRLGEGREMAKRDDEADIRWRVRFPGLVSSRRRFITFRITSDVVGLVLLPILNL